MDPKHFDRFARRFETTVSRRRILGSLLGLGAATIVTSAGAATCRPLRASCTRNLQCCSGNCPTDVKTPKRLRNRCTTCPEGATMTRKGCLQCEPWERACDEGCVTRYSNSDHCGACGSACPEGTGCSGEECFDAVICNGAARAIVDDANTVYVNAGTSWYDQPRSCTSSSECGGACPGSPCVCIVNECFNGMLFPYNGETAHGTCALPTY